MKGPRPSSRTGSVRSTAKVRSIQARASPMLARLNSTLACSTCGLIATRLPVPSFGSP